MNSDQISSQIIKCRAKEISINDTGSIALYLISQANCLSTKYLICLINCNFAYYYIKKFINNTVNLSINDLREFPIIIPTTQQLKECEKIFDEGYAIKLQQFSNQISKETATKELNAVRDKLNIIVYSIYGI